MALILEEHTIHPIQCCRSLSVTVAVIFFSSLFDHFYLGTCFDVYDLFRSEGRDKFPAPIVLLARVKVDSFPDLLTGLDGIAIITYDLHVTRRVHLGFYIHI